MTHKPDIVIPMHGKPRHPTGFVTNQAYPRRLDDRPIERKDIDALAAELRPFKIRTLADEMRDEQNLLRMRMRHPVDFSLGGILRNVMETPKRANRVELFDSPGKYMNALEKRGFMRVGKGVFSSVYSHPSSDKVVKVGHDLDDGWITYTLWAQTTNSPYACKLYSFKQYSGFYVAVIEKVARVGNEGGKHTVEYSALISDLKYSDMSNNTPTEYVELKRSLAVKYCEARYPGLIPFLRLTKRAGMLSDLHNGNWGVRKDGSLCIFDPCSCNDTKVKSRFSSIRRYKNDNTPKSLAA